MVLFHGLVIKMPPILIFLSKTYYLLTVRNWTSVFKLSYNKKFIKIHTTFINCKRIFHTLHNKISKIDLCTVIQLTTSNLNKQNDRKFTKFQMIRENQHRLSSVLDKVHDQCLKEVIHLTLACFKVNQGYLSLGSRCRCIENG